MTTQEAKLRNDIPRKEEHNKYSELYFPELRSTLFSIFSGDTNVIESITRQTNQGIKEINETYIAVKEELGLTSDPPVQVEFSDKGLEISVIVREDGPDKPKVNIVQFACLSWDTDVETLIILAKSVNETVLKCTRLIPKLASNRAAFKNINQIESNPVYDVMVLVFSMYKMLKIEESLPGCYVQALMARKRITYNMLCHTLKYSTDLPPPVREWFKRDDIVRKQDAFAPRQHTQQEGTTSQSSSSRLDSLDPEVQASLQQNRQWALHLIDYTGQKFTQRLCYSYGPKREYTNDRFITIDGDASITG